MKKFALAATIAAVVTCTGFAAEGPQETGPSVGTRKLAASDSTVDAPRGVRASFDIIKDGKHLQNFELTALEGRDNPWSFTQTMSYVSDCKPDGHNEAVLTLSEVTTGITGAIKPILVTADGALLKIDIQYSELDSMTPRKTNACTIEIPNTHGFNNSVLIQLKPGQKVELPGLSKSGQYSVIVHSL
jgi:hypothetical protein